MSILRRFWSIVNLQTFIVLIMAFAATYLCRIYEITVNLPTTLIGIAIVFPIVFSINAAYRRREEALRYFASLKAHGMSIYFAFRDWPPENKALAEPMRAKLSSLLQALRTKFITPEDFKEDFHKIYEIFSDLSRMMEDLRHSGVPANEISRTNQYLRAMIIEFERMRNIFLYRTPKALRAYSQIFLNTFPILYAPYFAHLSNDSAVWVGFLVAGLYSLVLVSLDNIQESLENPFDAVGVDDVDLDIADEYASLMKD